MDHLRIVLHFLKYQQIFENFNNCGIYLMSVALLCHILKIKVIEVDHKKMNATKSWPRPLTHSNIRSILGLTEYYRRFVEGFSSIVSPLTTLNQMKAMFVCLE